MPVRVEKRGIRALGVAECFRLGAAKSDLAGVVLRSDLVVDGAVFGHATVGGDDATLAVIEMYHRLNRGDINVIILGGAVISLFNIIDVEEVFKDTKVPTICVTFEESEGLEYPIRRRFPESWVKKLEAYRRLGGRDQITLKTGYSIYVRGAGIDSASSKRVLDKFTLQGSVPEPIRLAKMLAKARLDDAS